MRRLALAVAIAIPLFAASSRAQEACPCIPLTYEWIATPCDSWNCAASAVVIANGTNVVPLPTTSSDYTWVVLRRVVTGSAIVSPDAPFKVDGFDSLSSASARFYAIDHELTPMLVTVPDGKVLVVARSAPEQRRRVIAH